MVVSSAVLFRISVKKKRTNGKFSSSGRINYFSFEILPLVKKNLDPDFGFFSQ